MKIELPCGKESVGLDLPDTVQLLQTHQFRDAAIRNAGAAQFQNLETIQLCDVVNVKVGDGNAPLTRVTPLSRSNSQLSQSWQQL